MNSFSNCPSQAVLNGMANLEVSPTGVRDTDYDFLTTEFVTAIREWAAHDAATNYPS